MMDPLEQLRAANPVPDTELTDLERARSERVLRGIIQDDAAQAMQPSPRRNWFKGLVAAAVLVVFGAIILPSAFQPTAAAQALVAAGEAAEAQPDAASAGISSQEYMKRRDQDGASILITEYEVPVGGPVEQESVLVGPDTDALQLVQEGPGELDEDFASQDVPQLLHTLLHPALTSAQQASVYRELAERPGIKLNDADFSYEAISFRVLPETGQLVEARNLVAPGVETTVEATAILGCVAVTGLEGPREMSLACADNNYSLRELEWSNWGAEEARARGQALINDCDPNCAEGKFGTYPVEVTVGKRQDCGYQARLYSSLEVTFEDGRREHFDIGCTPAFN